MRVLIAPDSFKESMSAWEAAHAIQAGFLRVFPNAECRLLPMADGGEGTLDAVLSGRGGKEQKVEVPGPLGKVVEARWALCGEQPVAVIEMAEAAGLHLVPLTERDPWCRSSRGVGHLILRALDAGCRRFLIGIGGSATNDGGMGALSALGVRFLDAKGEVVAEGAKGLCDLQRIDLSTRDPRLADCHFEIASDVKNPFIGPHGASYVYGPQKGACVEDLPALDAALERLAVAIEEVTGIDVRQMPGAGAAGGIGGGFAALLGAELKPGADFVADLLGLDKALVDVDLVLTGEGQINAQSRYGKAIVAVAKRAKLRGAAVVAFTGSLGPGYRIVYDEGVGAVECLCDGPRSLSDCIEHSQKLLADAAERVGRLWHLCNTTHRNSLL